ncbi:hypothetical protein ACX8Z9_15395 [Arthrobacter halodurans]|uniref:Uncharacterized protein n=1 Tax=Arthrobacter halodurans TaxID=516699 RepID=A0ABV4URG2_9MICC
MIHLNRAYEGTPDEDSGSSQSRIDALHSLLDEVAWSLEPPMAWEVYDREFRIDG